MTPQNIRPPRRSYDTFHMGRSGMDLYSNDVGVDFVHIRSFAAYVGGSPANMSVGCRRLGNACGAMVVTRHGCSISMPFFDEVIAFADGEGGL